MTKTPVSSILLVLLASLIGSFGAVYLKLGAAHMTRGFRHILNWQLGVGIFLYLGSSVPFVMAVKHGELSVLYPMVSLGYIWTLFWSKLFFKEAITKPKVAALAMILAGIVCIEAGRQ